MRRTFALIAALLVAIRLLQPWFLIVRVAGRSMEPTLREGSLVLALRLPPTGWVWNRVRVRLVRRGAIVVARQPDSSILVIKRVIGMQGEWQRWPDVDGHVKRQVILAGTYFLQGDALASIVAPADSRTYGPFPHTALYARVIS